MQKPPTPKLYLNSQEAADILRISIRTLERMRVEGTGPKYLKAGAGMRSRVLYRVTVCPGLRLRPVTARVAW